jgi:hemoglobin/transferrin/lactoferrin receptor protein
MGGKVLVCLKFQFYRKMRAITKKLQWSLVALFLMGNTALMTELFSEESETENGSVKETPVSIGTVKVTADQSEADVQVDSEALELQQAWNTNEMLESVPQIDMGGGTPNSRRFYLRGISDSLVSISIDGALQNSDMRCSRSSISDFDTDLLKSVDVYSGPTAADQGYGNTGGSVKLTTKDAQDMLIYGRNAGLTAKVSYASVSEGWKDSVAAYGIYNGIGVLAYASYMDTNDYKAGDGETMLASSETMHDYFVKISALDMSHQDFRLSFESSEQIGLFPWTKPCDMGQVTDMSVANRQSLKRETFIGNYKLHPENPNVDIEAKVFVNNVKLENYDTDAVYTSKTKGLDIRNTFAFDMVGFEHKLTVGVDYNQEDGTTSLGTLESSNSGVFLQNRLTSGVLALSFGARYDDFEMDFITNECGGNSLSPNVNAELELGHGFSLLAGYGTTSSATNTIPLNWTTNIQEGLTFNGDVDGELDPEKSEKIEAGFRYAGHGILTDEDSLRLSATIFETTIEDVVMSSTSGGKAAITNIINGGEVKTQGYELLVEWTCRKFGVATSYVHNDVEEDGVSLTSVVKRTATNVGDVCRLNLNYELMEGLDVSYTTKIVFENEDAASTSLTADGYVVHGIQVMYQPKFLENIIVSFAVENLFDKAYVDQATMSFKGDPILEPGRDIRVGVTYHF